LETLLVVIDLVGTFVFALSGALLGVRRRLDLFGVLVLAFAASTGGGIVRDVLIGATPPKAIDDWRYAVIAGTAGILTFWFAPVVERLSSPVLLLDAAGLALFAVAGSLKALEFGVPPLGAVFMGMLTGIGGGVARDILVAKVPSVLQSELYAMAALAGATVVVLAQETGIPLTIGATAGGVLCFALRVQAIRAGWRLPVAPEPAALPEWKAPRRGK
jgi:uncharacterized membrane protein YeiH